MFPVVYSAQYHIDIGAHVFPTIKYGKVFEAIQEAGAWETVTPEPASWDDLALVHTQEYLGKVRGGTLTPAELAQLQLPWSNAIVDGFRLMTGGTIAAARLALDSTARPLGLHIGGGFHHAFAGHGEGFCLFNDVAVAIRVLRRERGNTLTAVVDLDVHHGNGTAMIFGRDPDVFTFSVHQQHNYPDFKPRGSLDIGLDDGTGDDVYLQKLRPALERVFDWSPQCVFYLAGADPYEDDQLGGLALSKAGLAARDRLVFETCRDAQVPIVLTLAGGYARQLADTVDIHRTTLETARQVFIS